MRLFVLTLGLCACGVSVAAGPRKVQFPYTTTVVADSVEVRSGPGGSYYSTGKLRRGQQVVVQRSDPGGWNMIAPPPGSFSWIAADQIRRASESRAVVVADHVDVRVGGRDPHRSDVYQARLNAGDEVEVLDEQRFPADGGRTEKWCRIVPPRGEWRWVSAQQLAPPPARGGARHVIPAGGFGDEPAAANHGEVHVPDEPGFSDRSVPADAAGEAVGGTRFADDSTPMDVDVKTEAPTDRPYLDREADPLRGARPRAHQAQRPVVRGTRDQLVTKHLEELELLDKRFQAILDADPAQWEFSGIERDYRALKSEVVSDALLSTIDTRLSKIAGYRQSQSQRLQLRRIFLETERRDAQLVAALQAGIPPDSIVTPAESSAPLPAPSPTLPRQAAAAQRFDGAGVVQRVARGPAGLPFALVAPDGKLLAYLAPTPGVRLEDWVGREAGVSGRRVADARLRSDVITVAGLTEVRLVR